MSVIALNGMRFYAHHGCFEEEQVIGTYFRVDLSLTIDTSLAERSDDLEQTVNYAEVYRCVRRQMEQPSHLLEHVARRIIDDVRSEFPKVDSVVVRVSKLNPPLGGQMESASVEVTG